MLGQKRLLLLVQRQRWGTLTYSTEAARLWSREKIKKKCGALTTQQALDDFWAKHYQTFLRIALKMEKAAADFPDDKRIQAKIARDRTHMRNELSYVERWIATCAEQHGLKNPVMEKMFSQ